MSKEKKDSRFINVLNIGQYLDIQILLNMEYKSSMFEVFKEIRD